MVLQALLDVVGDEIMDIVELFREEISVLESKSLSSPSINSIRSLHSLSAQLLLLGASVRPIASLIQSLRYSDSVKSRLEGDGKVKEGDGAKKGFISSQAKVYLSDILDHVESSLATLELFSNLCENLLSFNFNDLSYASNNSMKTLSVISIIFLPLTFLSGYFGMNFQSFEAVTYGKPFLL